MLVLVVVVVAALVGVVVGALVVVVVAVLVVVVAGLELVCVVELGVSASVWVAERAGAPPPPHAASATPAITMAAGTRNRIRFTPPACHSSRAGGAAARGAAFKRLAREPDKRSRDHPDRGRMPGRGHGGEPHRHSAGDEGEICPLNCARC